MDVSVSYIQNYLYIFHGKTAGSQVCGHNESLLYLLWATIGSCTCTGEMGEPFPACPGIERRGRPSHSRMGTSQVIHMPGMTPGRGLQLA